MTEEDAAPPRGESWSTDHLVELLAGLGSAADEAAASRLVVERAAVALEAEVGALVRYGRVVESVGFPPGRAPDQRLVELATGQESTVMVDGAGVCHALVVPLDDGAGGCLLVARAATGLFTALESSLLRGMGQAVHLTVRAHRLLARERELQEESQRRAAAALHDPLTGLANRACFIDQLDEALVASRAGGAHLGVVVLDLDRFKVVNDSFGFAAGDELLLGVSARLQRCLRPGETAARLGSDEFAILVDSVHDATDLVPLAERVMACFRSPFPVGSQQVTASASIGVAIGGGLTTDAGDLLRDADVATYAAKAAGPGGCIFFEPAMQEAVRNGLELEADLRRAVARRRLTVAYQPIIDLRSGDVVGAEALARWPHPDRGLVPPSVFIPLAETSGLIAALGAFVLEEACREAITWHRADDEHRGDGSQPAAEPYVSVNMSPQQLLDPEFVAQVTATLTRVGLDPGRLVLEITEQTMMHRSEEAIAQLQALKNIGIRIAVDDFGTGYSSLGYLARFPVDILKIDKSFIDGIATPSPDADLAAAIVRLGQSLQLETLAEGVETSEQLGALDRLGCDFGQGFLFAHPVAPEELFDLRPPSPAGRPFLLASS